MHMGTLPYNAVNIFGKNEGLSMENIYKIANIITHKMKKSHNFYIEDSNV